MKRLFNFTLTASIVAFLLLWGCSDSQFLENDSTVKENVQIVEKASYYWYEGKKIFLEKIPDKQYVVIRTNDKQGLPALKNSNSSVIPQKDLHQLKLSGIVSSKNILSKKSDLMWTIAKGTLRAANITDDSEVVYNSPFYKSSLNGEIGISHLFYVKLKDKEDNNKLEKLAKENKVEVLGNNEFLPLWYTLSCDNESAGDALQMANLFYETGLFAVAEPDIMKDLAMSTPNDTYFGSQWNLNGNQSINWLQVHQITQGENVIVGVIDHGIEMLHPDLDNIYPVYDTNEGSWYATNLYGPHGTACAGIIGARTNNKKGVAGIAAKATIYSFASTLKESPNITQELASGLALAANSVDVISCSWGGYALTSSMIKDAIVYNASWGRNGKGVVVVFSTGNNSSSSVSFPANCNDKIIAVGASGKNGKRLNFSNYGNELDVVAPGEYIPTTDLLGKDGYSKDDYYMEFNGTSAACPHVAAVAALILSVNNNLTSQEVGDIIERTARKVGGYTYSTVVNRPNGTWNREMGYGLIDANEAVKEAKRRL